jgi:hypothetical protein
MTIIPDDIIAQTNAQRKRLNKPLLSREGAEKAACSWATVSPDTLVAVLVDWVIPSHMMYEYSSACEIPRRGQRSVIL